MKLTASSRRTLEVVVGGFGLCLTVIWLAMKWPGLLSIPGTAAHLPESTASSPTLYPFLASLKLIVAALLGIVVTAVHKYYHRDRLLSRSLEQAEVLLCVAGSLMMIIIGDSVARAFGVVGAASIVRFRTPVDDPKDTAILFILVGIGMACGVSAFGVAGLAATLLCLFLFVLDHIGEQKPRVLMLEIVAEGTEFPTSHVQNVFAAYGLIFEPREVSHGKQSSIKYHVVLAPNTPLDYLSEQLISGGFAGIKTVSWETPKKAI